MKEDKTTRGGSRPGAGRPSREPGKKRRPNCFSVSEDTFYYAAGLRALGHNPGDIVERELRDAYNMAVEGSL